MPPIICASLVRESSVHASFFSFWVAASCWLISCFRQSGHQQVLDVIGITNGWWVHQQSEGLQWKMVPHTGQVVAVPEVVVDKIDTKLQYINKT